MPRPDPNEYATAESRSKGGHARAEKLRAERDELRRQVAEARRKMVDDAIDRLAEAMSAAIASLVELAISRNPKPRA